MKTLTCDTDTLERQRNERIEKYVKSNPLKSLKKSVKINPNAELTDFPYDVIWLPGYGIEFVITVLSDCINTSYIQWAGFHDVLDFELSANGPIQRLNIHIPREDNSTNFDTFHCNIVRNSASASKKFEFMLSSYSNQSDPTDEFKAVAQIRELASANQEHRAAVAEKLKAPFNSFVQAAPQTTLEQKKKLGRWITAELAQYGLAVECPNTPGLAVEVKGDAGNRPGVGRFQFLPLEGDGGGRKQRVYRDVLPELNFVQITNSVDLSPSAKPEPMQAAR